MPVEMVWNLKRWTKIQRRGATRSREGAWSLGKLESRAGNGGGSGSAGRGLVSTVAGCFSTQAHRIDDGDALRQDSAKTSLRVPPMPASANQKRPISTQVRHHTDTTTSSDG